MTSAEAVSPRGRGSAVTAASVTSADTGPPLVIPGYGRSTLADLSTSLLASLGVPGEANPPDLAARDRRHGLGTAARASGGGPVPGRAGPVRPAAERRVPGHHGDQPELARHRPPARPARDARLPGRRARHRAAA